MRYLSLAEVLYLHRRILESSDGSGAGIRDLPMLESVLAQSKQTFGGSDLYPSLGGECGEGRGLVLLDSEQSPVRVRHNKRHAGMEGFLLLNGAELQAGVDEQEQVNRQLRKGEYCKAKILPAIAFTVAPGPT